MRTWWTPREEAARQAAARVAFQQRAEDAQRGELMKALAIWGLPREAEYVEQCPWWEIALEKALRPHSGHRFDGDTFEGHVSYERGGGKM